MARRKVIIKSHKEPDNSYEGRILGGYFYTNPGPWTAKILQYVETINNNLKEKKVAKRKLITCYVVKTDGPECELVFKGPKTMILEVINYWLIHSDILDYFDVIVK